MTVRIEEDDTLTWRKSEDSTVTEFSFGTVGETVLAGCDFNGDGASEPAVISSAGVIRYRLNDETGEELTILPPEGGVPTHFACGDVNGDSSSELAFIFQSSTGTTLHLFASDGGEVHKEQVVSPRDLFRYEGGFAVFSKAKNRAFLDHFRLIDLETVERVRLRLQGSKKAHYATALFNGESELWTLIFYGKSGNFFSRNESNGRILRSEQEKLPGDGLLHPQNLGATAPPANEDPNALCPTIEDMRDGPGGRLWKQSDHTGVVALYSLPGMDTLQKEFE